MPKKLSFFFIFSFLAVTAMAQFQVTLKVVQLPVYHSVSEPLYVAGNFNGWNPKDEKAKLETDSQGRYIFRFTTVAAKYEYKLTRGSWDKVESGENGFPIPNREMNILSDTTIEVRILHWSDHFPKKPKVSTANSNVHIIDTAFYIPQLERYRRVWIYLPADYATSKKKYPVLYMHDGQNVFDDATSFSGEWGVDESMDSLSRDFGPMIIVAIDNGGDKRLNEYAPFDHQIYGKGEGDLYVDFLVNTLQPYINEHYRTKKAGKYNYVAGSSMGGLISLYAILKYPKRFGAAGVFSPAFWIVPQMKETVRERARKVKGKVYFFAGKQENESMVPDMLAVFELMHQHSKARITSVIRTEGKHNEQTWRKEFPLFYKWLMEN